MELDDFWTLVFTAEPFLRTLAIVPESLAAERVVLRLPLRDDLTNHARFLHAGAQYTLGEAAATASIALLFRDIITEVTIVTAMATITYQRAAPSGSDMVARVERPTGEGTLIRQVFEAQHRARIYSYVHLSSGKEHDTPGEPITVMTVESVVRPARQ